MDDGVLVGDAARSAWTDQPEFMNAYEWMRRQMSARLGGECRGLLWLWADPTRRDLVRQARIGRGDVLITCTVPRERVLLSDFNDWHLVLNAVLNVPRHSREDADAWSARLDAAHDEFEKRITPYLGERRQMWPPHLLETLEQSWEAIFDVTGAATTVVQATTEVLHADEVSRAIRIV